MNVFSKIVFLGLLMAMAGTASADDKYKIDIGGDYNVEVDVGPVTSVAIGEDAHADINIGGIQVQRTDVSIGGDYDVSVNADAVTAVAIGENVSARINLGGIQSLQ